MLGHYKVYRGHRLFILNQVAVVAGGLASLLQVRVTELPSTISPGLIDTETFFGLSVKMCASFILINTKSKDVTNEDISLMCLISEAVRTYRPTNKQQKTIYFICNKFSTTFVHTCTHLLSVVVTYIGL